MEKNYHRFSRTAVSFLRPPGAGSKATGSPNFARRTWLAFTALFLMLGATQTFAQDGDTCETAINLATITSPYNGTTVGATDDYSIECAGGGNTSPDLFFYIEVPVGYILVIGQPPLPLNNYDSVNYIGYGGACPGETQIACWDDVDEQTRTWENTTGSTQTVYFVQDGYAAGREGTFTLEWSLTPPPTCNIPTAVTATLTSATVADISWGAPVTGTVINYEYAVTQSETPPATGTVTTALSATGITVPVNVYSYLHVRTNCGTTDGYSEWVTYRFYTGYCLPAPFYTDGNGITNFTTGSINNNSGAANNMYANYSDQVVNIGQGVNQAFSVTLSTAFTGYNVKIWIDWNNDLDFFDEGEEVYSGQSTATNTSTLNGTFTVPAGATLGEHRMRIGGVATWYEIDPCYASWAGTFEDYTVNVTVPPTCFTPGGPMAVTTGPGTGNLSWNAPALGTTPTGYEYAVTTSTTAPASGTAVTGTTVTGATLTINQVNYLYVRTNCGNGNYSEWVAYSFYHGICLPSPVYADGEGITNVTIGSGINNTTEGEEGAYADYSNLSATIGQGVTQPFSLTFTTAFTAYTVRIWVDWNNDLDFDDEGEQIYTGNTTGAASFTLNGNFTVPATVALGSYRMRIGGVATWNTITPCYTGYNGTFEDYTITVTTPPACFTPLNLMGAGVASGTANLSWTAPTLGGAVTGYEYAVTTSQTPPATGTVTTATSVTGYTGIEDAVYYYLHVRTNCGTDGYSEWSTSPAFRFLPGDTCSSAIDLTTLTSPYSYTTLGAAHDTSIACNTNSAPDLFYYIEVPHGYTLEIGQPTNNYDSVNYLGYGGACPGETQIACWDDVDEQTFIWENTTGTSQTVYWVQDGYNGNSGNFTLDWTLTAPPACNIPRDVIGTMTSLTTADISWALPTTGTPTGYEYAVTTSQTPPASGTATTAFEIDNVTTAANAYNYVHVRTNCGPDGYSEWVTYRFYSGHCLPSSDYVDYRIVSFTTTNGFSNIANTIQQNTGYTNYYDSLAVSQEPGGSFVYSTVVQAYTNLEIWVDWNNDLDFSDEGELVSSHTNNGFENTTYTGSIAIPGTAAEGSYRVRVRSRGTWITPDPCAEYAYGSAQDYRLDITAPPTCYTPINVMGMGVASGTANLSWEAQPLGSAPTGYEYFVSTSPVSPASGTATTATSVTGYTPIIDNTYYYLHVRVNCGGGDYSQWAVSLPFRYLQGDTCETAVDLGQEVSPYTYSTEGAGNDFAPICSFSNAPELFYSIEVPNGYTLNIGLSDSSYDSVHVVYYGGCDPDEQTRILCTDSEDEQTEWENLTGSTQIVYWVQDGYNTNVGEFTLEWELTPPAACDIPRELDVDLTSLTTADISWIVPNTGSPAGYDYAITTSATPPADGTYTTTLGATGVTVTPNVASYLHVRSNCGDTDGTSLWVTYEFFSGYCPAGNVTATDRYISNVTITGAMENFSNSSAFSAGGFGDYTQEHALTTYAGGTFTITASHPSGTYAYIAWIDWNQNFEFGDLNELVRATQFVQSPATLATVTVPMGTPEGTYRMRIRNAFSNTPVPACGNSTDGETEDYTVIVGPTPTCFPPYGIAITPIDETTADLSWSPPILGSFPQGYEYVLSTSPTEPTVSGEAVTEFYIPGVAFNPAVNNYLWVRSSCGDGEYSDWASFGLLDASAPEMLSNSIIVNKQGDAINITSGNATITGVTIFDIRGRKLYSETDVNNTNTVINGMQVQQQVLIVEVTTDKGKVSKRIVY